LRRLIDKPTARCQKWGVMKEPPSDAERSPWKWLLALGLLWSALVALSVAACGAGFLRSETFLFLPHYLQHRPWYELIFDARGTDPTTFQARELGHLLAYVDSQFIRASVLAGWPHFFSLTHYLLLLGCGLLIWQIGTRSLLLGRGTTLGLILLLWTSPSAFLFSSYYRPGKIGLCFGTLLFAAIWFSYHGQPSEAQRRRGQLLAWLGIAALLLPMYDKQGLAFLFVVTGFCAQRAVVTQTARDRAALFVVAGALLLALIYARGVSPLLTRSIGHAEPSIDYQSLPMASFLRDPRHIAVVLFGAPVMAISSLQFVAGNLSMGSFLAALAGTFLILRRVKTDGFEPWLSAFRPARLYLLLLLLVTMLFALLLVRNPYMFTNEHRRFFYGAPLSAVWLIGLALLAGYTQRLWPQRRAWITAAVAVLVIGNIFAIPDHRFVLRQGEYALFRQNARRLCYALAPERILRQSVKPGEARALLAQAPRILDAAAPASPAENSIFLALLAEYAEAHPSAHAE